MIEFKLHHLLKTTKMLNDGRSYMIYHMWFEYHKKRMK